MHGKETVKYLLLLVTECFEHSWGFGWFIRNYVYPNQRLVLFVLQVFFPSIIEPLCTGFCCHASVRLSELHGKLFACSSDRLIMCKPWAGKSEPQFLRQTPEPTQASMQMITRKPAVLTCGTHASVQNEYAPHHSRSRSAEVTHTSAFLTAIRY